MAMSMLQSTLPYKEMNILPRRAVIDGSISVVDGFDLLLISGKIKVLSCRCVSSLYYNQFSSMLQQSLCIRDEIVYDMKMTK